MRSTDEEQHIEWQILFLGFQKGSEGRDLIISI